MKYYVVIDTNVIVSGLLEKHNDSNTVKILKLLFDGDIVPIYSDETMDEYKEVLNRPFFKLRKSSIGKLINAIKDNGLKLNPKPSDIVLIDNDDIIFYELVMDKTINSNKYLITGNIKHYLKDPIIVTPEEFVEIFEKNR